MRFSRLPIHLIIVCPFVLASKQSAVVLGPSPPHVNIYLKDSYHQVLQVPVLRYVHQDHLLLEVSPDGGHVPCLKVLSVLFFSRIVGQLDELCVKSFQALVVPFYSNSLEFLSRSFFEQGVLILFVKECPELCCCAI